MGEVVLKGGMAAFQVISVALPAGKGLTALGRTGSHLLAASVAEAAEEDLLAIVGEDGNKKIVVNLGGEGETGAGTINVQHIGAESPMYGGSRPEVQGMSLRQIAAKYPDQHFIITDYSRLPFRANSVDVIHVNGTRIGGAYRGVPYPQLDEILRVLKDDGQFFRDGVLQGRPQ